MDVSNVILNSCAGILPRVNALSSSNTIAYKEKGAKICIYSNTIACKEKGEKLIKYLPPSELSYVRQRLQFPNPDKCLATCFHASATRSRKEKKRGSQAGVLESATIRIGFLGKILAISISSTASLPLCTPFSQQLPTVLLRCSYRTCQCKTI